MKWVLYLLLLPLFVVAFELDDWRTITNMNDIKDIVADEQYLWAATTGGVFRYDPANGEIRKFTNIEGMQSVHMEAIAKDDHNVIIAAGKNGIMEFYHTNDDLWVYLSEIQGNTVRDIVVRNDSLWVAAGKGVGLFLWDGFRYIFYDYYYNFPVLINEATRIELFNNRIWLGSDNGLLSAPSDVSKHTINDPEEWVVFSTADSLPSKQITALKTYDNKLWIGTSKGLAAINANMAVEKMSNWGEGSQFAVTAISQNDNDLLITSGRNLFRYLSSTGRTFIKSFSRNIVSVLGLSGADYVVSLDNDGIYLSASNSQIKIDGPNQNLTRYIFKDHKGQIWASSSKPLMGIAKGFSLKTRDYWLNTKFNTVGWAPLSSVVSIYEDEYQNIWLGSWGGGMMALRANGDTVYFHGQQFPGRMVISTYQSYEERDQTNAERYHDFLKGVPDETGNYEVVSAFKQDQNNYLWIGNYWASDGYQLIGVPYTNDNFISLDKNEWKYFRIKPGGNEEKSAISCMEIDMFGRIWCGTVEDGIYILDHNNTLDNTGDDKIYHLGDGDGLFSNSVRSIAADKDGVMWIGTTSGLNTYDGVNVYKHVGDKDGLTGPLDNRINFIFIDNYSNRWIATPAGVSILRAGHNPWDPNAWVGYTTENSNLVSNDVHCIYVDPQSAEALIATEDGLSIYSGRFAQIRADYNQVSGGPNPFVLNGSNSRFTITNLKSNSTIKIYTINGKLVRELTSEAGYVDGGRAVWDGRDEIGQIVSTGIYLFAAFDQDGDATAGKIAVIRK